MRLLWIGSPFLDRPFGPIHARMLLEPVSRCCLRPSPVATVAVVGAGRSVLWEQNQQSNTKIFDERNGVSMFLALTDDECHEVVDTSHDRWRTPFEHDVLLPQSMKDAGVPYMPSWDKKSRLPGQVAISAFAEPASKLNRKCAAVLTHGHASLSPPASNEYVGRRWVWWVHGRVAQNSNPERR